MNEITEIVCTGCLEQKSEEFSRSFSRRGDSDRKRRCVERKRRRVSSEGRSTEENKESSESK